MQGVAGVSLSALVDTLRFYHWVPVILISFWKAKIAIQYHIGIALTFLQ